MKRISGILLAVVILITIGGSYAYSRISVSGMSELSGSIAADSEGRFYILGNTKTQFKLMRVNSENVVDYYYSTPINTADSMLLYGDIFVDEKAGRIYTTEDILDNKTNLFASSGIVYFDMSQKRPAPRMLFRQNFGENPSENYHIKYIYPSGDFLYFTSVSDDLKSVSFCRLDTSGIKPGDTVTPEVILTYKLPGSSLANKTLCGKDFIIVQTMDSDIYRIDSKGSQKLLFPTSAYGSRSFPLNLSLDSEGILYFNEIFSHDTIAMDSSSGNVISALKGNTPVSGGSSYLQKDIGAMSILSKDTQAFLINPAEDGDAPIPMVVDKGEARAMAHVKPSQLILLIHTLENSLKVFAVLILLFAVIKLFRLIYRARPSLLMKLVTFVLPIVLIAMFLFSRVATFIFDNSITDERMKLVKNVGNYVAQNIDTSLLSHINNPQDMDSEAYGTLLKSISKYSDFNAFLSGDPDYTGLYCVLMKVEKDQLYTAVSADMPCFVPLENLYSHDSMELYRTALKQKSMVTGTIQDVQGIWTVSVMPVFNSDGEIAAMLEAGINSKDLEASILRLSNYMLLAGIFVSLAVLLAFWMAVKILLRPLKLLKEAVVSVYNGNYGTVAVIKANDEVADIGRVFNKLSAELNSQFGKLTSLNQAYYKLISPDIFSLLRKNSILDVSLGDQVSIKMTIMNASIRNFENITSGLSPETTFNFINQVFKVISSNIGNYSGIIHSYNVDKFTVMFQNNPEKALESVICIRSELAAKNYPELLNRTAKVDAGFYIHTTPCIYGIIGDEDRYSPTVVSENNDIIYSLDSVQHSLMCSILVTQNAFEGIAGPGRYNYRYIGYMTNKDSLVQIGLYEFFDGDDPHVLNGKKQTLELFNSAMAAYHGHDFYRARNLFAQIVKVNSEDTVARWFLFRCDSLCKSGEESNSDLAIAKF